MHLTGTKVVLREFRPNDADDVAEIIGDDRVTYWLSFDSRTKAQARAMISRAMDEAQREPRTEYYLAIAQPADDRLTGFIRLELTGVRAAKLGFAIHADHWRHGLALDAARTLLTFAFDSLDLHRVTAAVGPQNIASQSLMAKLRFMPEGRLRDHVFTNGEWRDSILYSLLAHERPCWPAGAGAGRDVRGANEVDVPFQHPGGDPRGQRDIP